MLATADKIVGVHDDEQLPIFNEDDWETEKAFLTTVKESSRSKLSLGSFEVAKQRHYLDVSNYISREDVFHIPQFEVEAKSSQPIRAEIIAPIAKRPHESIKRASKLSATILLFSLVIYFVSGVLIINPVVSFFGLIACTIFWLMASVDKYLYHR